MTLVNIKHIHVEVIRTYLYNNYHVIQEFFELDKKSVTFFHQADRIKSITMPYTKSNAKNKK